MVDMAGKNIFLWGQWCRQEHVGKYLASRLDMVFFDTDEEIEKRTGVDIGWIFDVEGEEGFRRREETVVADIVTGAQGIVLATGGGTILSSGSRQLLSAHGAVHLS